MGMAIGKRKHTTEQVWNTNSGSENSRVSDLITSHLLHALSGSQCCFDFSEIQTCGTVTRVPVANPNHVGVAAGGGRDKVHTGKELDCFKTPS